MSLYYKTHFVLKKPTPNGQRFKNLCPRRNPISPCEYNKHILYKTCKYCKRRKIYNIFASICNKKSSFKNIDQHI